MSIENPHAFGYSESSAPEAGPALEYLGSSGDLHCMVDRDWRFVWMAGPWERILGWGVERLLRASLDQLLHPADADGLLERLRETGEETREHLGRLRRAGAGFRWIAWTAGRSDRSGLLCLGGRDASDRMERELDRSRRLSSATFAATHDPLTGLANRTLLTEHLRRTIARSARSGVPPLVLFVDLDRFKRINDDLGHKLGDEALRTIAARLRAAFRPSDLVARHGGDEFVVVLEDGDPDAARARIERATGAPIHLGRRDYGIGASVGAALIEDPQTGPGEAIAAADRDMYMRKRRPGAAAAGASGVRNAATHPGNRPRNRKEGR